MYFEEGKKLSELTTFGLGGPARFFVTVTTVEHLQKVICYAQQNNLPFFPLGKGSNVLFDDRGFDGIVILNKISFCEEKRGEFYVGAGYSFSLLGTQTARKGWAGLEFASGIPGSVGGAIYMNAGANGERLFKL
ncbi:MAG: FAD-binding protein [Rhabdochlamydiaceae bacterium]|jgi:UDP-N-acetylmuramate dehydrogenase